MQSKQTLEAYPEIKPEVLEQAYSKAVELVTNNIEEFTDYFPDSNSKDNFYPQTKNVEWTTGFWTGEVWLAYEATKDEKLKIAGNIQVDSFLERINKKIDVNHHDMGFLYSPSCVAAYKLTGNEKGKEAALKAADNLMLRFQEKGQFFQAWGDVGAKDKYSLIIDSLLNMPLLFWASKVIGNEEYADKAETHIKTVMDHVIRKDFSTYHTYFFDPCNGKPLKGVTHQGNRDGSSWARGQAWGIYGTAIAYGRLKNPEYLEKFERLTDYFFENLPSDLIPYWDFDFNDGSDEPRDSSAAAIVICGMLEMSEHLPKSKSDYYISVAKKLLKALLDKCAVKSGKESGGLLLHGTYARGSETNSCTDRGVDECNTWGDYYFLEALTRCTKDWDSYW